MHFTVNQQIVIHQLRVDNVTNASILQIGSAGMIKPVSNAYSTTSNDATHVANAASTGSLVPLPRPTCLPD